MKVMLPKMETKLVQPMPEFVKSPIKLSISLLVSNRIHSIRKCMESLKPIMDAVPSELIAVDTVGEENSDGSLAIVREYTDQVVHFDWTGDFSEARNTGLELAKGEWFLYVDDDEWFDDPTELIEFFHNDDCMKYGCTQYVVRSYTDETMTNYSEGWVSRMVRRTPKMRFIHRVHELLSPMYFPEKKFTKLFAHHVGYVFKNEQEKAKHLERNLPMILKDLEDDPNNMRLIMQAIQEYLFNKDYEKAEEYCWRGIANQDRGKDVVWNWIAAMLIRSLVLQKRLDEAMCEGRKLLGQRRLNELAQMDIHYALVSAAQEQNDLESVLEDAFAYSRLGQYLDENPDQVLNQVMLSLSDILMESKREEIHKCIFMTCKKSEQYAQLCKYAESIAWDKAYMQKRMYLLLLAEAAVNTENYACLTRVAEKVCSLELEPVELMDTIREICDKACTAQYFLRKAFARAESERPYFLLLKAWCAEQDGGDVPLILQKCLEHHMDCAVPREELLGICLRTGNDPTPFLEPLYMEDWALSFSQLVKNTEKDNLQELLEAAQKTLRPICESQYFVLSKMIRQKMLDDPDYPEDQLWIMSKVYMQDILGYNRSIYQEELFADSKHNLPRETVFALYLREALQAREQGCLDKTLSSLKECLKAYPPRKNFVTRLISNIKQELEQENQQKQEFSSLGEQIKKQIYYLISLGQTVQAQQVLEQLRILTPHDQELDAILQKIS